MGTSLLLETQIKTPLEGKGHHFIDGLFLFLLTNSLRIDRIYLASQHYFFIPHNASRYDRKTVFMEEPQNLQVKSSTQSIEPDKIFLSGFSNTINPDYLLHLDSLSLEELKIDLDSLKKKQRQLERSNQRTRYIALEQAITTRIKMRNEERVNRNFARIREQLETIPDVKIRRNLLIDFDELVKIAEQGKNYNQRDKELEVEIQRHHMQLDTDNQKLRNRMEYLDRFLERESVATILGVVLLIIIAIVVITQMDTDPRARELIYNGFLILLGYFFAQKVIGNRNSTDS